MFKRDWIWAGVMLGVFFLALLFGQYQRAHFLDTGLSRMTTYSELEKEEIYIASPLGMVGEDLGYNSYSKHQDELVSDLMLSSVVAIVEPTGVLEIGKESFGQEFTVKTGIRGDLSEGDVGKIYTHLGFSTGDRDQILYHGFFNVMKPGEQYLIFMEPTKWNSLSGKKEFNTERIYGYFNVKKDASGQARSQYTRWKDAQDEEFFVTSQRLLDEIYRFKNRMLSEFAESIP